MKSLYEGILDDIETSVGRMDSDIEKVHIFEWLEYNAVPNQYETLRTWTRHSNGKFSTYEEWNEVVTINPDKSVSFKCGIELLGNNKTKAEKVPFKIHSVDGKFLVGSPLLKTSENFPDIVDSIEFAYGIKIKLEDWHVKVKNSYRSNKKLLKVCKDREKPLSLHRFSERRHRGLSYGVMVAQQVLVLFVLVRIQVGQLKNVIM